MSEFNIPMFPGASMSSSMSSSISALVQSTIQSMLPPPEAPRWITAEQFVAESKDGPLCSYSPADGEYKDLVCGAKAVSFAPCQMNPVGQRCSAHYMKMDPALKRDVDLSGLKPIATEDREQDTKTGFNVFTFDGKTFKLRQIQPMAVPIEDTKLLIKPRPDIKDFKRLSALCPNATHVVVDINHLAQCNAPVRSLDVRDFLGFKNLKHLEFKGTKPVYNLWTSEGENKVCGRITHLASLNQLDLESLTVYGQALNPRIPHFDWPLIRRNDFKFISGINTTGPLINYTLDYEQLNGDQKAFFEDPEVDVSSVSVIIQRVTGTEWCTWIYHNPESYTPHKVEILPFDQFTALMTETPPTSMDEVMVPEEEGD